MPKRAIPVLLQTLAERIEAATALDTPAAAVAQLAEKPLARSAELRRWLSGTDLGHPVHPLLVALPIGSFTAASVLDLTGQPAAAKRLIGLGLLTAIPTAMTGGSDWVYTTGAERRLGFVHAATNWLAIAGYAASWRARRRGRRAKGMALALTGAGLLSAGGWLGGHLVYARGVGVDTTAFLVAGTDWQDAIAEADVAEGQPVGVEVAGVPVVLVRQGADIYALDDRCSHRGGPLHDGELVGSCLRCPWHDSGFAIADGQVLDGPATRPQRVWQVRRRDGRIQVRIGDEPGSLRRNVV